MPVEKLIKLLQSLPAKTQVRVASDEERNTIFRRFSIEINTDSDEAIIFGLSGSEQNI